MSLSSANRSLQLVIRMLDSKNTTEPLVEMGPQKPLIPLGRSTQPLPRVTPESQGIPSRHVAGFLRSLAEDPTLRMHSVLILRNGRILCEAAFGAQDPSLPRMTFSACKSITALAVGLCMDDGLLSASDKLTDLFPEDCGPVARRLMKDLTLEHLLTMQTGNTFNEASSMTLEDWTHGFFTSPSLTDPTGKFQYNSLNTYMLAVLVRRKTGKPLTQLLEERLFGPMGIGDYYWEKSPEDVEKGGWGLYLRAEDLAKLGQLVQDGGCWNGHQLISREFLAEATRFHIQVPEDYGDFNYGWQMWVGRQENTVLFNGMLGQNVLCFRDSGITVVSHAGNSETFQQSSYFRIVQQYFGGSFPQSLPREARAQAELRKTLRELADCTGRLPEKGSLEAFRNCRFRTRDPRACSAGLLPLTLQAVENSYSRGLQAISVGGDRDVITVLYEERDQLHEILAGTKEPLCQNLTFHGNSFRVAAQARVTHDEDDNPVLRLQLDFLETPCSRILKLIRRRDGVVLKQEETPNVDYLFDTMLLAAPNAATRAILNSILGSSDTEFLQWKLAQVFAPVLEMEEE